mmetsp:Transcript_35687/g.71568  ORF Transcript_35687/g.71568 Transcript_35687/m.71568 type:complete len:407 (-) Transcript_35687:38-1258(-)
MDRLDLSDALGIEAEDASEGHRLQEASVVRDCDDGAVVGVERGLDLSHRLLVQVVRRLVQHQRVRPPLCKHRQQHPGPRPGVQLRQPAVHLLPRHPAPHQPLPRAELGQPRHRCKVLASRYVARQALVLLHQVAHPELAAQGHISCQWRHGARQRAQERALAHAVEAHNRDAFAEVDAQRERRERQRSVGGVAEEDGAEKKGGVGACAERLEVEAQRGPPNHALNRTRGVTQRLHSLRLPPRAPCPVALEVMLQLVVVSRHVMLARGGRGLELLSHRRQFLVPLLLRIERNALLLQGKLFRLSEIRVARPRHRQGFLDAVDRPDVVTHGIEKLRVMRDHHNGLPTCFDGALQPHDAGQVEMIGWFVEHKELNPWSMKCHRQIRTNCAAWRKMFDWRGVIACCVPME